MAATATEILPKQRPSRDPLPTASCASSGTLGFVAVDGPQAKWRVPRAALREGKDTFSEEFRLGCISGVQLRLRLSSGGHHVWLGVLLPRSGRFIFQVAAGAKARVVSHEASGGAGQGVECKLKYAFDRGHDLVLDLDLLRAPGWMPCTTGEVTSNGHSAVWHIWRPREVLADRHVALSSTFSLGRLDGIHLALYPRGVGSSKSRPACCSLFVAIPHPGEHSVTLSVDSATRKLTHLFSGINFEEQGFRNFCELDIGRVSSPLTVRVELQRRPQTAEELLHRQVKARKHIEPGACLAQGAQVCALMWARTILHCQYASGGGFLATAQALYKEGGFSRFYMGMAPALLQTFIAHCAESAVFAQTGGSGAAREKQQLRDSSAVVAILKLALMPFEAWKIWTHVWGRQGLRFLLSKWILERSSLWEGAACALAAVYFGHFPWLYMNKTLRERIPELSGRSTRSNLGKVLRSAVIGFLSASSADVCCNWLLVLKTVRQTSLTPLSYTAAAKQVIRADGWLGLFVRGLPTKILISALQNVFFFLGVKCCADLSRLGRQRRRLLIGGIDAASPAAAARGARAADAGRNPQHHDSFAAATPTTREASDIIFAEDTSDAAAASAQPTNSA